MSRFRSPRWSFGLLAIVSALIPVVAQSSLSAPGVFVSDTPLTVARNGAATTVLPNGTILATGGTDARGNPLAAAEYLGSGSSAGSMLTPRSGHIAVVLQDGRVLVSGGRTNGGAVTNAAEIFIPASTTWATGAAMLEARTGATATLLEDGRVFIAGGNNGSTALRTTEIYDPASGQFSNGPNLAGIRQNHAAALLRDGRVVLAGGSNGSAPLGTIEIFDPSVNAVATASSALAIARTGLSANTLLKQTVLLAGGTSPNGVEASTEIFDSAAGTVSPGPAMSTPRTGHSALLLPNNNTVMMVGGTTVSTAAEMYVSWQNALVSFGTLSSARSGVAAAAEGQSGTAHVAGGQDSNGAVLTTADKVRFPMVKTDKPDYQPGDTAFITGSGFGPNETVSVVLEEVVDIDNDSPITLTPAPVADASGNFSATFPIDEADLGVRFYLSATGQASGLTAGITFTDARNLNLTFAGIGSGSVKLTPDTGTVLAPASCGGSGLAAASQTVTSTCAPNISFSDNGATVTFLASGTGGSSFAGWSGQANLTPPSTCSGTTNPCSAGFNGNPQLTVTFNKLVTATVTAANKIYDGTTTATINTCTLSGVLPADVGNVTCTAGSATFSDKNVGNAKTVTAIDITLGGSAASKYSLSSTTATTTANITARPITVTAAASSKTYDGTTSSTGVPTITSGSLVSGDTATWTETYDNKNVGTAHVMTPAGTVMDGNSGNNYTVTFSTINTGVIAALHITGSFVASNKVYDGNTSATVSTRSLVGAIAGDVVSLTGGTATFNDKTVANGKTVTLAGATLAGSDAGNYVLDSVATTTANITALHITGTFTADNKVYDGNNSATVSTRSLVGAIAGDVVSLTGGTATFSDKNVGNGKTVTLTGSTLGGSDAGNYMLDSVATTTANITALHITGSFVASNKVYDGNTSATVSTRSLVGAIAGDIVSLTGGTATFSDKNVGNGKTVTLTGSTLTGADAANYMLDSVATTTANITALHITGTFTASNKVYDGNTSATVSTRSLVGAIAADTVSLTGGTATFSDKNVGNGKTVTLTGATLGGTDAGNYVLDSVATATANITPLHITGTFTANNKVYDGNASASVLTRSPVGALAGDVVTLTGGTATFNDKTVVNAKTVTLVGATLGGADAGNYALDSVATTTANITALHITGAFAASNKVYDGNNSATVQTRSLVGAISGDAVSLTGGMATFADKNVGAGKTVTLAGASLSGADAGNYMLDSVATTTASITALHITGTFTASNKVYDGNSSATVLTRSLVGAIAGDTVSLTGGTATFSDKNVGNGKTVTLAGATLGGTDAGNYVLDSVATTTANITALGITGSFTASDKVYNANTVGTITGRNLTGVIGSDSVTLTGGTAAFADKNVSNNKTVTGSGFSLGGGDAGNYMLSSVATTTANITQAPLTVTATGVNKVYDATTAATVTLADNRIPGDVFTDSYSSASFLDKNAGNGKTVNVSGISISGTDAGNYSLSSTTASTSANITQRPLTVSATGVNKVYDATTAATVTLSDNRIAGDVFTDSYSSASFLDKIVGTGKVVNVSGISISGTDAGNYSLSSTTASTTANITQLAITGSFTASSKVYDTTTAANIVTRALTGVLGTDNVSLYGGTATFADKNVGTNKIVTGTGFSLAGTDAGNYLLSSVATTTANITQRPLTVSATGVNKVYDATTAATVTLADNHLGSDAVTDSYGSASFVDKNVGMGKVVNVSGISISGMDAGNYTLSNTTASAAANITKAPLMVTAMGVNKVYDATTAATVTLADNHLGSDAVTDSYSSASFVDKNVGTGKVVNVSGISISGTDAGNYSLSNATASTTANVTQLAITGSFTAGNKVYDTTTAATITGRSLTGAIGSDSVTLTGGTAAFADKNVSNNKTVTGSGFSLGGGDAGNYMLSSVATTTANITPAPLTMTATGVNKLYDSTTAATVTLADNHLGSDAVTDSYGSASFVDKNVGMGKVVNVSGISISGTDAGNYSLSDMTASTSANITQRPLTVSATGVNKVYDATTAATVTLADNRLGSDAVTDSYSSASFVDKNVGTGKVVNVSGISISGTDAGNYSLSSTTASSTANITQLAITGSFIAGNKVYDTTTAATITGRSLTGAIGLDSVSLLGGTATFADKNVGYNKIVTGSGFSLSGGDAGNYILSSVATTTANITKASLTVTATGVNKVYDATTAATVTLSDNRLSGDVLTDTYSGATFATPNVGTLIPVTVNGISIAGTDSGNYTFNSTATTPANIVPASTTTALASSLSTATTPVGVVLKATVASTVLPSGSVKFTDITTSTVLGTISLASGQATLTVTTLGVGPHVVSAAYIPDTANFMGSVSVTDDAPGVTITGAPSGTVQAVNTTFNFTATFTDTVPQTHSGAWSFDNASIPGTVNDTNGTVTASYSFAAAGVYGVKLTVNDGVGGITIANGVTSVNAPPSLTAQVVVYDPSAGFVTGGGWINSPAGAYTANTSLTGKATFGFVSKYEKGANVPTGETEFNFQVANFNFHSALYQWLVISGPMAQYKGSGTLNGSGNYNFILTGRDGALVGGSTPDGFRIKITDPVSGSVIYDNLLSTDDSVTSANTQTLGGGSIVVHSK